MSRIKSNLSSRVKKGAMTQAAADAALAKVKGTIDYSDFKRWVGLGTWGKAGVWHQAWRPGASRPEPWAVCMGMEPGCS